MATKKDYVAIADIVSALRNERELSGTERLIKLTGQLADYFEQDNPQFNRQRFSTACLPADGSIGGKPTETHYCKDHDIFNCWFAH